MFLLGEKSGGARWGPGAKSQGRKNPCIRMGDLPGRGPESLPGKKQRHLMEPGGPERVVGEPDARDWRM